MAALPTLRHSIFLAMFTAISLCCRAQADWCSNPSMLDSAIGHIQQTVHYTSPEWQQAWDSLLAKCPQASFAWQMKAMPNIKAGNYENAFGFLAHAVRLNEAAHLPYQAFLKCIFAKDYEGALPELDRSEQLARGAGIMDHSFRFYRGLCYLCLGNLPQARKLLEAEIADQTSHRGAGNVHHVLLFYYGILNYKERKWNAAAAALMRSIKAYPQYPDANFWYAKTIQHTRLRQQSLQYLQKAKDYWQQGYTSNEDQEYYVNYPFEIALVDIENEMATRTLK